MGRVVCCKEEGVRALTPGTLKAPLFRDKAFVDVTQSFWTEVGSASSNSAMRGGDSETHRGMGGREEGHIVMQANWKECLESLGAGRGEAGPSGPLSQSFFSTILQQL